MRRLRAGMLAALASGAPVAGGGPFVIDTNAVSGSYERVSSVAVAADGAAVGSTKTVNTCWGLGVPIAGVLGCQGPVAAIKLLVDDAGNSTVVWGQGKSTRASAIYARRYSAAGAAIGTKFALASLSIGPVQLNDTEAAVDPASGQFVAGWLTIDGVLGAQAINSDKPLNGASFTVASPTGNASTSMAIAAEPAGDLLIVLGDDGTISGLRYQLQ